ncbi:hypothetical protein [Nocardia sp. CA-290969]|uniref:hypothetical protein n=1 Tax=Nocardia sp. CA-290969 TaxID=3239986 RepID=UPI003D89E9ED
MAGNRVEFQLDRAGVSEILKSPEMAAVINETAAAVADQVREDTGEEPEVESYTTDRGAAAVGVPVTLQATDGALTRAAAAVGLVVVPQ